MRRAMAIVAGFMVAGCSHGRFDVRVDPGFVEETPRCVAVIPLENFSLTSFAGIAVGELLSQALESTGQFVVLEPTAYQFLTRYLNVGGVVSGDPEALRQLRSELGIDAVVIGSVSEYWYTDDPEVYRDKQPSVALSVRMVDTASTRTLWRVTASRTPSSASSHIRMLTSVAADLTRDIAENLKQKLPEGGWTADPDWRKPVCKFEQRLARQDVPGERPQPAATPVVSAPEKRPAATKAPVELNADAKKLVERLKRGEPFVLRGVGFEYQTTDLKPSSNAALESLAQILQAWPDLVIEVIAHSDNAGDPDELQSLTLKQAEKIRAVLSSDYGIAPSQIVVRGRGGAEPLLPNINRRNRQINRRVEIRLVRAPAGGW